VGIAATPTSFVNHLVEEIAKKVEGGRGVCGKQHSLLVNVLKETSHNTY